MFKVQYVNTWNLNTKEKPIKVMRFINYMTTIAKALCAKDCFVYQNRENCIA